jgi:hypothetical protein
MDLVVGDARCAREIIRGLRHRALPVAGRPVNHRGRGCSVPLIGLRPGEVSTPSRRPMYRRSTSRRAVIISLSNAGRARARRRGELGTWRSASGPVDRERAAAGPGS